MATTKAVVRTKPTVSTVTIRTRPSVSSVTAR